MSARCGHRKAQIRVDDDGRYYAKCFTCSLETLTHRETPADVHLHRVKDWEDAERKAADVSRQNVEDLR